jgi:hypothetical protein
VLFHREGRTQVESVRESCAEDNIGRKTKEVTGGWRKLHIEELNGLCASFIRVIKGRVRWAVYVDRMEAMRGACRLLLGS